MTSQSLQKWQTVRTVSLDEIEAAHGSVGGSGRGRRYATQQINQAYTVLLSSQFQGFCRDLHSECLDYLLQGVPQPVVRIALSTMALTGRKLDSGNPNPGNIGADFSTFVMKFWDDVYKDDKRNKTRGKYLETLNVWRNAIAHQNFTHKDLAGATMIRLATVQQWRSSCNGLANSFDKVMRIQLQTITGTYPW